MRLFFLFLTVLLCFSSVFCLQYDYLHISSELFPEYTNQKITIGVTNDENELKDNFIFFIGVAPDNIAVSYEGRKVNYSMFYLNNIPTLRIYDTIGNGTSKEYVISFTSHLVESIEDYYLFSYSFTSYHNVSDYSFKVILPQGYGIVRKEGSSISPPPSNLYSNGQQIIISWEEPLSYGEQNAYLLFFQPLATEDYSLILILSFSAVSLLIGGMGTYLFLRRKRKELVVMALSSDEKKVVDYVSKKSGGVYQNELLEIFDFSKSKLSKIVSNLSSKNIVTIEHSGRKNLLRLNDKIL